ncbi:MAG: NADAR family protein [Myxococcales bacterium]|nr:NADAR family protein [Myxococcales bacterium]
MFDATATTSSALTVRVPAAATRPVQDLLSCWLLHDAELGSLESPDPGHNCLTLHPRVASIDLLPADRRAAVDERGGVWDRRELGVLSPAQHARLYTVLFYSGSRPEPALLPDLPATWRRVLSNFHREDLVVDGHRYASVEHYFQGQKALCSTRPAMASRFRADDDDSVGPDPAAAKSAGSRKAYTRAGASLDGAAWERRRLQVMRTALAARWAQQPLFRAVLSSTAGLELLHFERSGARSYWGGNLGREDGLPRGQNHLGLLLMALRDEPPC